MRILAVILLLRLSHQEELLEVPGIEVTPITGHPCHENGVVASWCDARVSSKVDCSIHPTLNVYACTCDLDPSACPSECVGGTEPISKTRYGIGCRGIPQDEPNYILRGTFDSHHHCGNNALVASWCNEWTVADVNCLLLPSLDEYVCNCHANAAACPEDCVGGTVPDKKTKHGIRCKGIPADHPNYVLLQASG
jgi:hypothetical protein